MILREIKISFDYSLIIKVILVVVFAYIIFLLKDLFLLVLASIVLSSALAPAINYIGSIHILGKRPPRFLAIFTVYFSILFFIFLLLYLIVPSFVSDINKLSEFLPQYLGQETDGAIADTEKIDLVSGLIDLRSDKVSFLTDSSFFNPFSNFLIDKDIIDYNLLLLIFSFWSEFISLLLVLLLSFYFSLNRYGVQTFIRIVTPIKQISYALNLWERSQVKIGAWIKGQFLVAVINGSLSFMALSLFTNIENVLPLAFLSALFTFVPIFGPFLAFFPAALIGFLSAPEESRLGAVLIIALIFLFIQILENNFIQPLIVNKFVGINPILVIISLIVGGSVFGFLGVLLAIPAVSVLMIYINDILHSKNVKEYDKQYNL